MSCFSKIRLWLLLNLMLFVVFRRQTLLPHTLASHGLGIGKHERFLKCTCCLRGGTRRCFSEKLEAFCVCSFAIFKNTSLPLKSRSPGAYCCRRMQIHFSRTTTVTHFRKPRSVSLQRYANSFFASANSHALWKPSKRIAADVFVFGASY